MKRHYSTLLFFFTIASIYAQKPSFQKATGTYDWVYPSVTQLDIPKGKATLPNCMAVSGRVITAVSKGSLSGEWRQSRQPGPIVIGSEEYYYADDHHVVYFLRTGNEDLSTATMPSITFKAFTGNHLHEEDEDHGHDHEDDCYDHGHDHEDDDHDHHDYGIRDGLIAKTDPRLGQVSDDTFTVTFRYLAPQKPVLDDTQGITAINITSGEVTPEIYLSEIGQLSDTHQALSFPIDFDNLPYRVITAHSKGSLSGKWQYKITRNPNWEDLITITSGKYLLLESNESSNPQVRFLPSGNENTEANTVTKPTLTIKGYNSLRKEVFLALQDIENFGDYSVSAESMTVEAVIKPATAPKLSASIFPTSESFLFTVTSNKAGTLYWVVQKGAKGPPSATQVRNLQDYTSNPATYRGSSPVRAHNFKSITLSSLSTGVYKIYFLVEVSASVQSHLEVKKVTIASSRAVSTNSHTLSKHTSRLRALKEDLSAIEDKNDQQSDSLKRHESEINDLESSQSTQDTDISALQSSQSTQDTEISTLQSSQGTQDTEISALQSSQSTQDTDISALQSSQSTQDTEISTLQSSQGAQDSQIAALEVAKTTQERKNTEQDTKISALENRPTPIDHSTDIVALQSSQSTQDTDISTLQSSQGTQDTDISALQSSQNTQNSKIAALEAAKTTQERKNTEQDTKISALENRPTPIDHSTDIVALQSSQSTQDTDIDALQSSQGTQDTEISTLKAKIKTLEAEIEKIQGSSTIIYNVPEAKSKGAARAYPNPTTQQLQFAGLLSAFSYICKIYSPTGVLLHSCTLHKDEAIDISSLSQGQYLVILHTESGEEVLKSSLIVK